MSLICQNITTLLLKEINKLEYSMKNYKLLLNLSSVLACLFICVSSIFAQSTTIEMLGNAKVWRAQFPGKDKIIFEISFSKTEWTDQFTYDGTIAKRKSYFYLSDQLVKEFDQTKVGTSDNGKYIIQNLINRKSGEKTLKVYEIVELTSSEMKLKDLSTYDIIFYKAI